MNKVIYWIGATALSFLTVKFLIWAGVPLDDFFRTITSQF